MPNQYRTLFNLENSFELTKKNVQYGSDDQQVVQQVFRAVVPRKQVINIYYFHSRS